MNENPLRIVDANLNRLGEGLRVLEEVTRMTLNDKPLSQQLKDLRHDVVRVELSFHRRLVAARDSAGDVGAEMDAAGESKQRNLTATVVANARRAQESLRVLEEMAKLPEIKLDSAKFRKARFALYTIEKDILGKLPADA
jgi:thiamine-phosphate pyrophosphorylase